MTALDSTPADDQENVMTTTAPTKTPTPRSTPPRPAHRPYRNVRRTRARKVTWEALLPDSGNARSLGTYRSPEAARRVVLIAQAQRLEEKAARYRAEAETFRDDSNDPVMARASTTIPTTTDDLPPRVGDVTVTVRGDSLTIRLDGFARDFPSVPTALRFTRKRTA